MGVTVGCKLSYGCWESNPDPLEEYLVLLIIEPSLQPQEPGIFYSNISDYTKKNFKEPILLVYHSAFTGK